MKARTIILTASAFVVLAGPAAHTAGAMIPRDEGSHAASAVQRTAQSGTLPASHVTKTKSGAKSASTAIDAGSYSAYAYVQGGASQKVAKAITAAGKKAAKKQKATKVKSITKIKVVRVEVPRYVYVTVPAPAGPSAESTSYYCLTYVSDCTDVQFCEIWGVDCGIAPPPPLVPVEEAPATEPVPAEPTALSLESGEASQQQSSSESSGQGAASTSDLYQDS